jgi:hypothetical protein
MIFSFRRAISVLAVLLLLFPCALVRSEQSPPLIVPIAQDPTTSLYTISIKDGGEPLVVDLAGSLVWSTCPSTRSTVPCHSDTCRGDNNNQHRPRRCRYVDAGRFWATREPPTCRDGCACTAQPFNPFTGECSTGDLTTFGMSADATDGMVTLHLETVAAAGSCAPDRLTWSLPAAGVAEFSTLPLSLPSQLAAQRGFGDKFALCMPGFAAFGNTSLYLGELGYHLVDYKGAIQYTPILASPRNPGGYYVPVQGISVSWNGVDVKASLPKGAFDLDALTGRGGVVLSTVTQYARRVPPVRPGVRRGHNQVRAFSLFLTS